MANPLNLARDQILLGDLNNLAKLNEVENPSQDDVRLYASIVRRLLLDGVLPSAAGSRKMPLSFLVPDAKSLVSAARNKKTVCFVLGGLTAFGISICRIVVSLGNKSTDVEEPQFIGLKLDGFLKQTVGYINGTLISRHDVISYVSNKAGGVHYDMAPSNALPAEKLKAIGQLRRSLILGSQNGTTRFAFDPNGREEQSDHFRYMPEYLDAMFMEFHACMQFIVQSPQVNDLKAAIVHDLKQ